jgi:hypothetical protein
MAINGNPVARVGDGEIVGIRRNMDGGGGGRVMVVPSPYFDVVVDRRAAGVAAPMAAGAELGGAARAQRAIYTKSDRRIP